MASQKKEKRELFASIEVRPPKNSMAYGHIDVFIMEWEHSDIGEYNKKAIYADIKAKEWDRVRFPSITAQCGGGSSSGYYAHQFGWQDEWRITIKELEIMLPFMRKAHKKLDTLSQEFGSASSFGEYVVRCVNAMGIKDFCRKREDGSWYHIDTIMARFFIESLERDASTDSDGNELVALNAAD